MVSIPRGLNREIAIFGVSSIDNKTPEPIRVDPDTKGVIIDGASLYADLDERYIQQGEEVGDIESVVAGTGLTGGGTSAEVTLSLDTTYTDGRYLNESANLSDLDDAATALTNLGLTATASELNILDGATLTTTELNYVDGVTSAIQTQLDGKLSLSGGIITGALTMQEDVLAEETFTCQGDFTAEAGFNLDNGAAGPEMNFLTTGDGIVQGFFFYHDDNLKHGVGHYTGNQDIFLDSYDDDGTKVNVFAANAQGLYWRFFPNGEAGANVWINADLEISGELIHDGAGVGFYGTTPIAKQTGVAVSAAGIHAALVNLGLISA